MFTGVTSINTNHLGYLNATTVILPCNTRSVETYSIRNSRITNLVITYTAGTFAFNGSWNNSSSISYIYVPDTKMSAYSGRTVYPIVGKESIIEKDREFSLSIPSARYGWNSDLHWSVEENDYISIVSQGDGVATFRATGILPDTDTTVTLSYQSNRGNGYFKGTKVLTVKPTPVIEFEDAEVKRICVANWGGPLCISTKVPGVPGELTYEQAAAVSSIGTTFSYNNVITTILELEYFVNVKSLASGAFRGCQSLIEVRLDNITSIANSNVFRDCYSLKELVFKNLVSDVTQSNVGYYNYRGTRKLKFIRYDKVTTITQYRYDAMTPVFIITHSDSVCSITSGSGMPAALYVPDSMVESYKSASVWSNMASKIYPISQFSSDYPDSDILDK